MAEDPGLANKKAAWQAYEDHFMNCKGKCTLSVKCAEGKSLYDYYWKLSTGATEKSK